MRFLCLSPNKVYNSNSNEQNRIRTNKCSFIFLNGARQTKDEKNSDALIIIESRKFLVGRAKEFFLRNSKIQVSLSRFNT